jgi:hypothetical protein
LIDAISSRAPAGIESPAARSSAALYEPLLRLPETPTIVVTLRSPNELCDSSSLLLAPFD